MPSQTDDLLALAASSRPETDACFVPYMYAVATAIDPALHTPDRWGFNLAASTATFYRSPILPDLIALQHELTHAIQFLSSNFGLRCLINQQSFAATLTKRDAYNLKWPLFSVENQQPFLNQAPRDAVDMAGEFHSSYVTDLISGHAAINPEKFYLLREHQIFLYEGAYTVIGSIGLNNILFDHSDWGDFEYSFKKQVYKGNIRPPLQYTAFKKTGEKIGAYSLNVAALMEASAVIGEIAFLDIFYREWLCADDQWIKDYICKAGPPYDIAFTVFTEITGIQPCFMPEILSAVIDICLMYDRMIVDRIHPCDYMRHGRTPISLFFDACHAVAELGVPPEWRDKKSFSERVSITPPTVKAYQDEICRRIELPPMAEMTRNGIKVVDGILNALSKLDGKQNPLDYVSLFLVHKKALEMRLADSSTNYLACIVQSLGVSEATLILKDIGTLYNPRTSIPWRSELDLIKPRAIVGRALLDIIRGEEFDCPLRQGKPYYCLDKELPRGHYCYWSVEGESMPLCPYLLLRMRFRNPPPLDDGASEDLP